METRNISLTIEKAKEFYNSGNAALMEVALQAFTQEELTTKYTDIKTFEDACEAIGLPMYKANAYIKAILLKDEVGIGQHLVAIYKLDIIRKALNGNWKPSLVQGSVYYPYVRFYPAGQEAREVASSNNWKLGESFKADGQKYTLVGGAYSYYDSYSLDDFSYGYTAIRPTLGLLDCKSREIAEYIFRYFSKEIFEACYAHHVGSYQWI